MVIRWKNIVYFTGWILLGFCSSLLIVAFSSILFGEDYFLSYGVIALSSMIIGVVIVKFTEKPLDISITESMIIAVLSFVIPSFLHTIVMYLSGFNLVDSFFESVSGITTTGLSVFTVSELPKTVLFSRALLQWVGGVGIVILTLGFLLRPGTLAYKLLVTHIRKEAIMPSIMVVSRAVLIIYGLFTVIAIISYKLAGMSWFDSVIHGLTTISTGGFSSREYITGYSILVAIVFMFLSAQSFPRYYMVLFKRKPRYIGMGPQVKYFIAINIIAILLSILILHVLGSNEITYTDIVFTIISASTTTGYASKSIDLFPEAIRYIIIVLMVIGASLGSTGGGFKQYRLIILLKELWRQLLRTVSPHGRVLSIKIERENVPDDEVYSAILIINLYIVLLVISTLVFLCAGYSLIDSVFTVASALGTVGLAPSIVNNSMPWWIKILLSIDMLLGRLEIIPFAALTVYGVEELKKNIKSMLS